MKAKLLVSLLVLVPFISMGQVHDSIKALPKYGNDSVTCVTNLSLYRESYKQWKQNGYQPGQFDHSYQYWRWLLDNGPKASMYIYTDGIVILSDKIRRAADEAEKQAYIDTVMMVYDQRATYFGDNGNVLARKGLDYMKYRPDELQTIYDILSQSVDIEKNSSLDGTLDALFKVCIQLYQEGLADKIVIIENYDKIMGIVEYNIQHNAKNKAKFQNLQAAIEKNFEPFASCEDLIPIYEKKFAEAPEDIALLEKISYMLDKKDCTSSKLFEDVSVQYHKLNPSPESAFMLGKLMLKKEDYAQAMTYFKEAVNMEDAEKVYNAYILLSHCYQIQGNFPEARAMAEQAIKYDPTKGEPYMIIGQLYALSSDKCKVDGDKVAANAVFWVAVDMYEKAKQVDKSVAAEADKVIKDYSKYFPDTQTIFFSGLQEGDEYEVGCWINKKTKIRPAIE